MNYKTFAPMPTAKIQNTRQGRYYTPQVLVDLCYGLIDAMMTQKTILLDNSAGYGSFIRKEFQARTIAADMDADAVRTLNNNYRACRLILNDNSLVDVSRQKYGLDAQDHLIIIGNPPYNDRTSKNKREQKMRQTFLMDADIQRRDLGMAFLLSYAKLKAQFICVLHPLSYLIKPTNFKSLAAFYAQYHLVDSTLFSSHLFNGTQNTPFPIVAALYQRGEGMGYAEVESHCFKVLDEKHSLRLNAIETTDGYIRKYPPRQTDTKKSDLGLYFYNFRDANSLFASANFTEKEDFQKHITVHKKNLYQYAYLNCYKRYFPRYYVFGNFSPLVEKHYLESSATFRAWCLLDCIANNPRISLFQHTAFRQSIRAYLLDLLRAENTADATNVQFHLKQRSWISPNTYRPQIQSYFQHLLSTIFTRSAYQ